MYVVYGKCFRQLHSARFEFQPYIMKIYSLCIRPRECEEVEKKVQKKGIAYSIFYGFLCTCLTSLLFLHGSYTRLPVTKLLVIQAINITENNFVQSISHFEKISRL